MSMKMNGMDSSAFANAHRRMGSDLALFGGAVGIENVGVLGNNGMAAALPPAGPALVRGFSMEGASHNGLRGEGHRRVNSTPPAVSNFGIASQAMGSILRERQNIGGFGGSGSLNGSGPLHGSGSLNCADFLPQQGIENKGRQICASGAGLPGAMGGMACGKAKFHSLGLGRLGVQPTSDIVNLAVPAAAAAGQSAYAASVASPRLNGELMKFIMPSGPRKSGEGTEDIHQGIIATMVVDESAILVQMTLLVAGFVIGPSGESVRSIIAKTGASIYSYTEVVDSRKSRLFYIEGPTPSVVTALQIICAAVTRYKQLAEGQCSGHQVERKQNLFGVDFYYQPPPRSIVPYAAGLKISKETSEMYTIAANAHLLPPSRFGPL